jgi:CRISPR-associated exonuclease Cas4
MFTEADLLPLSALQHLAFCERQWALIHLEQQWVENRFTAEGRSLHEKAHSEEAESRPDLRTVRGLRVRCLRLGLVGVADVVEFYRSEGSENEGPSTGIRLQGVSGFWQPFPVEYKRGKPKPDRCDEVQLCAQALCLEEMLGVGILRGAIFYGRPRRRLEVAFDTELRSETEALSSRLHVLFRDGTTPVAVYSKKCPSCSLLDLCQPKVTGSRAAASRYIAASLQNVETEQDG